MQLLPSPFDALCNKAEQFGAVGFTGRHAFSNDQKIQKVWPDLRPVEWAPHKKHFGLVVGAIGPLLSYMVQRPEAHFVVADIHPFVTKISSLVLQTVAAEDSSQKAVLSIQNQLKDVGYHHITFEAERADYGDLHWSSPQQYKKVQEKLSNTSVALVSADITNSDFLQNLRLQATKSRLSCSFAALTNAHMHIEYDNLKSTIEKIPFEPEALTLFSSYKVGQTNWLTYETATSPTQYLDLVGDEAGCNII